MDARTEKARKLWDDRSGSYDSGGRYEPPAILRTRALLCGGARGRTLEVAVGTGRNLEYYPPQVKLTGLDLSPAMLSRARDRAEEQGRPVSLVEGDAQQMSFADRSFDTVVCVLALCAVPDQERALAEMHRVLVPGGRLLLVDHIEYTRFPFRLRERLRKHPRRLPRAVAEEVGFEVGHHDRLLLGLVERLVAHRPR
ncbi:ubiquinone/menaquinone biosynthesis methyltransferase [Nocardiopsis terrae]|uniref:SAM-dependent methyltransferase n=1 Tax=Nocardiopsis terrae TaxID=372655 RepID=A0ABR9HCB0_9ACTN|nr:class I SAM-dependent methyltransferase [Nocardiopsis terrae]MBE1456661.1 SAM-dependent methyltransferase [Nocardiopsis terrae]GHC75695.1 ubiquinone/menaquinone biosynthesis methyltransferase [Nocardiopsis terrae]